MFQTHRATKRLSINPFPITHFTSPLSLHIAMYVTPTPIVPYTERPPTRRSRRGPPQPYRNIPHPFPPAHLPNPTSGPSKYIMVLADRLPTPSPSFRVQLQPTSPPSPQTPLITSSPSLPPPPKQSRTQATPATQDDSSTPLAAVPSFGYGYPNVYPRRVPR